MVKNIQVEQGHFMFWPCKCGHVFGRHGGELFSGKMLGCFECDCKKFLPAHSLEKWRESLKKVELRCHDCEFSYARLGTYCFRLDIECPHPLEELKSKP